MFKNDNIYTCTIDVYKCGEYDGTSAFAFKSRKQARNFNRKYWGGCGVLEVVKPHEVTVYNDRIVYKSDYGYTVRFWRV